MRPPEPDARPQRSRLISLDAALLLGIVLIALGFGLLLLKGFKAQEERDELLASLASIDPYYNGGYQVYNINSVTEEELKSLPWMEDRVARGIIRRRELKPFRWSEELLEVPGIEDINIEMFRMYLYGFEDPTVPSRILNRPLGIPDA